MAVMGEGEREKVMKLYEAIMPEELEKMDIEVGKAPIERMVGGSISRQRVDRRMFSTSGSTRDGGSLRST